jgi:hypothetical protein
MGGGPRWAGGPRPAGAVPITLVTVPLPRRARRTGIPHPQNRAVLRWWDGQGWTSRTRPYN